MSDPWENTTTGLESPAAQSITGSDSTFDPCRAVLANNTGPITGLLRNDDGGAPRTFELIKGQIYPLQFKQINTGGAGVTLLY